MRGAAPNPTACRHRGPIRSSRRSLPSSATRSSRGRWRAAPWGAPRLHWSRGATAAGSTSCRRRLRPPCCYVCDERRGGFVQAAVTDVTGAAYVTGGATAAACTLGRTRPSDGPRATPSSCCATRVSTTRRPTRCGDSSSLPLPPRRSSTPPTRPPSPASARASASHQVASSSRRRWPLQSLQLLQLLQPLQPLWPLPPPVPRRAGGRPADPAAGFAFPNCNGNFPICNRGTTSGSRSWSSWWGGSCAPFPSRKARSQGGSTSCGRACETSSCVSRSHSRAITVGSCSSSRATRSRS